MLTWKLADVLAFGYVEVSNAACANLPTWNHMVRHKAHAAYRLTDDLWHLFRYADAAKAAERDAEMSGPMLPKRD